MHLGCRLTSFKSSSSSSSSPHVSHFLISSLSSSSYCSPTKRRFSSVNQQGEEEHIIKLGPSQSGRNFNFTSEQIQQFQRNGFIIVDGLLKDCNLLQSLIARFEPLFAGDFETGVYPDEWHWRKGMSLPFVTREICNAWKSDLTIASVVLSSTLGRLCSQLGSWPGARIGQDDLWWKPPSGGTPLAWHRDSSYISVNFNPFKNNSITCWLALDDTNLPRKEGEGDIGTLEYIKGSHLSPSSAPSSSLSLSSSTSSSSSSSSSSLGVFGEFHNPSLDREQQLRELGVTGPSIVSVRVSPGGVAFHHQDLLHGSGPNKHSIRSRRSIGIHLLNSDSTFAEQKEMEGKEKKERTGYIYTRYQLRDSKGRPVPELNESFFPVLWSRAGYRTPWLKDYCKDPPF